MTVEPVPKKAHELAWQQAVSGGAAKDRYDRLRESQALPLEEKSELTTNSILEWYAAFKGSVAVSFSGGIDSTALLHLVRSLRPDVPAVFCNTGLEYPEIVAFVKRTPDVTILRPRMPFHRIIQTYGYPVISKKIARGVHILRHPTTQNANIYGLYDRGVNRFGESVQGYRIPDRWRFLVKAPFECSDVCCGIMKKEPMHRYGLATGRKQYVGTLAADSKQRERIYIMHGCNALDLKHPRSMPLGFWTRQDVLEYIHIHQVPYCRIYGDIVREGDQWRTTGVRGTGCVFCMFGLHLENEGENRFQALARSHPRLWNYCMERLDLRAVLDYMRPRVPESLAGRFNPEPGPAIRQLSLF